MISPAMISPAMTDAPEPTRLAPSAFAVALAFEDLTRAAAALALAPVHKSEARDAALTALARAALTYAAARQDTGTALPSNR